MNIKKELLWGGGIALVVVILTIYYIFNFQKQTQNLNSINSSTNKTSQKNLNTTLTIESVQKHNQASDCWIIIDKKVYNVTGYLNLHPGGTSRIVPYCGQDATQAFLTKDGQGTHSQAAFQDLAQLYIGDVNGVIKQTPNINSIKNLPRREREENEN